MTGRQLIGEEHGLTVSMRWALRDHGNPRVAPNIGTMRALAKRGLVEDRGSAIGCRLWDCYPLTGEGRRLHDELVEAAARPVLPF